jgi:tetratricopeptide (TPR) repeat protein
MKHAPPKLDDSWLQAAAGAEARGELDEALRLWCAYRQVHPAIADGYLEPCRALRKARRYDEAEALCAEGQRRAFDGGLHGLVEWARIAEARGALDAALERWQAAAAAFPRNGGCIAGAARVLLKLHRLEEAEASVEAALARLPKDPALTRLSAQVAGAREDWPETLRRWDMVLAANPGDQAAARSRGAALWHIRMQAGSAQAGQQGAGQQGADAAEDVPADIVDVGRVADPQAYALLMRFESLGQNCEFGLVQRRFGAEPLSLLRWTFVKPMTLIRLLEARGAGMGDPGNVELRTSSWGEHMVHDRRFGIGFHTFMTSALADPDAFLLKQAARLRWLRDKLVGDLEEAEKFFVYKPEAGTPPGQVKRILRAMRTYGNARLLCMALADASCPPGSVRDAGGGLFYGYLSVHNPVVKGRWDIPFEEWLAICSAVAK